MKITITLLSVILLASVNPAQANDLLDGAKWYASVGEPQVEQVNWSDMLDGSTENTDSIVFIPNTFPDNGNSNAGGTVDPNRPNQTIIDWEKLVLIGEKIIDLVRSTEAVVNVKRDFVGVLPSGVNDWTQTMGWRLPISRKIDITLYSLAGFKLASASLKVIANCGGSVNGKGKFLRNVTVVPSNVKAYMGHSVDIWTEFRDPVNTSTVEENPIAALGFDIRYKANGIGSEKEGARDIVVTGEGLIQVND